MQMVQSLLNSITAKQQLNKTLHLPGFPVEPGLLIWMHLFIQVRIVLVERNLYVI